MRQLFKGGNYLREETINLFLLIIHNLNFLMHTNNVEMEKINRYCLVSGKLD